MNLEHNYYSKIYISVGLHPMFMHIYVQIYVIYMLLRLKRSNVKVVRDISLLNLREDISKCQLTKTFPLRHL